MFLDDPCVVLDVRRGGNRVDEVGQEPDTADAFERPGPPQRLTDGDGIDRLVRIEKVGDSLKDVLVRRAVEVLGVELLQCDVGGVGRHQDGAEHRLFCFDAVRGRLQSRGAPLRDSGHIVSFVLT